MRIFSMPSGDQEPLRRRHHATVASAGGVCRLDATLPLGKPLEARTMRETATRRRTFPYPRCLLRAASLASALPVGAAALPPFRPRLALATVRSVASPHCRKSWLAQGAPRTKDDPMERHRTANQRVGGGAGDLEIGRNGTPSHAASHLDSARVLPTNTQHPSSFYKHNMPVRIPRLPQARRSEIITFGAAGVGVLTPLYIFMPGAEERISNQTNKWAPRWERNINYFASPVERGVQRIEPPVARMVQRVDERLPLERMAKSVEKGIRSGITKFTPEPKSGSGPSGGSS
ncbi:hypothetical protein G7Z17_g5098 [Cylindrodendrum hubeiense]|uniref:Uncharacterized protein n=1 Tax=Cylindrodendrum hubeiense TaxID=595255 RepID=A0A9P5HCP8_9HYPO|nr:hypothetical protein G7Z17_g5098 [Cylindrodendrum hubeiense]